MVIQVPNIAYIKQRLRLLLGILPTTSSRHNWSEIGWDSGVLHSFTKKTFCVMMESSGFKIHKVTGSGLFSNIRNFYPSLLNGDLCILSKKVK